MPRPNPKAALRLFCFPYAGGSSATFRAWPESLPPSVEVCGVQLPGRHPRLREAPFDRLMPLAVAAAEGILPHLDRPFAFFGHSMGALLCFEVARHLRRERGTEPLHLFVSGARAPQVPDDTPQTYHLPDPELIASLHRLNGTPKEVLENPELMQLMLPLLRADFAVCETYEYAQGPPFDCPITAFGGLEDADVSREHVEAWARQTTASFSMRMFAGGHFFLNSAQPALLHIIARELHQIAGRLA